MYYRWPWSTCRPTIDRYIGRLTVGNRPIYRPIVDRCITRYVHIYRSAVGRYIGRLSVDYRSTIDRLLVDSRPIVDRYTDGPTDCRPMHQRICTHLSVGRRPIYRSTVGWSIGRLSTDSRSTYRTHDPVRVLPWRSEYTASITPMSSSSKTLLIPSTVKGFPLTNNILSFFSCFRTGLKTVNWL